eukprot:148496-Rhodomonas_salina.1
MASASEAHAMFLVPTQIHQNLRGIIDIQTILVHRFIVSILKVPVVPFSWLTDTLTGTDEVDVENDKYTRNVHDWLKAVVHGNSYLPNDGRNDLDLEDNVCPYVSTSANVNGTPSQDGPSLIRFQSSGHTAWQQLAHSFVRSPMSSVALASIGVPRDTNVYKNAIQ